MNKTHLAALLLSTSIGSNAVHGYESLTLSHEPTEPAVSFAVCEIAEERGRVTSTVRLLDYSHPDMPLPREGASCANYIADATKFGAKLDVQALPCEAILPGTEQYRKCLMRLLVQLGPLLP